MHSNLCRRCCPNVFPSFDLSHPTTILFFSGAFRFGMERVTAGRFLEWYKVSRSRFWFIVFAIPTFVLMGFVFVSYVVFFAVMFVVPLAAIAIAMLPGAIRTRGWYKYAIRIAFIFLIVFSGLVPNPLIWGDQISRRLDHKRILTPYDPAVVALNGSTALWTYIQDHYGVTPEQFKTWSIPTQVRRVYYYIDSLIDYTYDIDTNHVFDHVATPAEVLASGEDDCQGISCTLASLLIYMGYNAYVAECPFHWYVRVFYTNESDGSTLFYDAYRYANHPDPMYMFNETVTIFPQGLWENVNVSFTFDYVPRKFSQIMNGTNQTIDLSVISSGLPETSIPSIAGWLLVLGACLVAGFFVMVFLKIPNVKRASRGLKTITTVSFAVPLFVAFLGILFVPFTHFLYFALAMVTLAVFLADSEAIPALFSMVSGMARKKQEKRD